MQSEPYSLTCDACGDPFRSSRPHTRTCSHRCRQRRHVGRTGLDERLLHLSDVARGLVVTGQLEPEDALALVIWPSPEILAALADREAVAA